ncbi:uncharacterized protein PFL1_02398 [Pseudozyma flocculosa PF-1]|uniref:Ubiquitin-like 1-activating enzyme E1A n=1 Tax=Pseudozyma flocculosa TaxID=84751 RepID=A0A5C3F5K7_9BASI|nr:uncharacterized protein PFL1_02398 [Pseudozyma flocculosa PF-1]EPQ30282.1 hypothetical protein PFL1_02398 [Pseudozyma flocculosa PF-1]SPO39778.1 related to AOS1 - Smt3p activating protein [Pseudozyma flocculosa]
MSTTAADTASAVATASANDTALDTATTSVLAPTSSSDAVDANAVTEDEAALYDRQIRLWGLEAQTRMRTSHVLVWGFTGVATEVIKNIVLSGIGTLSILDPDTVRDEDLSAGFFWRQDDVGASRVADAPVDRIRALNPLVKVQGLTDQSILQGSPEEVAAKVKQLGVDVVVACRGTKLELTTLNDALRLSSTKFYATSSFGFGGYIFSDLGASHDFITERVLPPSSSSTQPEKKRIKNRTTFVPLSHSLDMTWAGIEARKIKRLRLAPGLWTVWASWEAQQHGGGGGGELREVAERMMVERGVDPSLVFEAQGVDRQAWFQTYAASTSTRGEFAPTCAVLGGLLAQDVLNALGGREEPITNWLILDAMGSGNATLHTVGSAVSTQAGVAV